MKWNETKILIKSDLNRLGNINKWNSIKYLINNASFKITFWFRIGSYLQSHKGFIYKILYMFVLLIHKHNQYLTGIQLPLGLKLERDYVFLIFHVLSSIEIVLLEVIVQYFKE